MTKKQRIVLFFSGVGVLGVFIFFSYLVHKNLFAHFDFDNTVRLQDHMSLKFITPFSFLSDIGTVEFVSIILLIVFALYRKLRTFLAFIFFGLLHFIELYGKTFVSHFPPPHFMLRTHHVFNLPEFYIRTENSYPSGHTGRALFLTILLAAMVIKTPKVTRVRKVFIVIALVSYDMTMGISRIYLGEHWTSDVIGGGILGLSMGLLGAILL